MAYTNTIGNLKKENRMERSTKLIIGGVAGLLSLLVLVSVGKQIAGNNDAGYYQIKQAALTGTMSVIDLPGAYARLFADVTTYHISDMYYFSKNKSDGGDGELSDPIKVRFNDGGTAEVSGAIKFRLPSDPAKRLKIHQDFKSYVSLKHDLMRQVVAEAMMQSATLMKAEESYSTRRAEFTTLVEDQVKDGIYETYSKEYKTQDADGNDHVEHEVIVKVDSRNLPIIRKDSALKTYGVEVVQFTVKDIDFDPTIDALIQKKKEAEQQKVVARANAEKAKQDAITAREQGNAKIAEEKATQEVEKIKQVTIAQKEFEVSQLRRKQAEQDSQSSITKGKAEAEVNKLKVAAGLTPLERANIEKETAIGVAEKLSQVQFPSMMVLGGGANGPTDPFAAVGLESFLRISKKLGNNKKHTSKDDDE